MKPFPPYDAPGPDGKPLQDEHQRGIPVPDNARKMAKEVTKIARMKAKIPRVRKPRFKSNVKFY